ncbi:hypothetical protein IC006_0271 [Sulfuracidifex tepidarius]|uniref:Uncharacterized protein n=2 Tax=Sulfuracidifex tepidarius TaxID=1294262 RepID=A0A510DS91_9CREN|nr:hypothetical protein IC006_0271 [Sulfuracidifex tepidarius]BBG25748.1 hypothetical protein IC007_0253 [Sulfuracidifex tepidarius]
MSYNIIPHKYIYMADFQDILNYTIMRKRMSQFEEELKLNRESPRSLKEVVKEFISFTKGVLREINDVSFREVMGKQLRIAKRLLMTINLRWVLIFLYKRVVTSLVNALLSLINTAINQIKL